MGDEGGELKREIGDPVSLDIDGSEEEALMEGVIVEDCLACPASAERVDCSRPEEKLSNGILKTGADESFRDLLNGSAFLVL